MAHLDSSEYISEDASCGWLGYSEMSILLSSIQQPNSILKSLYAPVFGPGENAAIIVKPNSLEFHKVDQNGLNQIHTMEFLDTIVDVCDYDMETKIKIGSLLIVLTKSLELWVIAYKEETKSFKIIEKLIITSSLPISSKLSICIFQNILAIQTHVGALEIVQLSKIENAVLKKLGSQKLSTTAKNSIFQQKSTATVDIESLKQIEIFRTEGNKYYVMTLKNSIPSGSLDFYSLDLSTSKISMFTTLGSFPEEAGSPNYIIKLTNNENQNSCGFIVNFLHKQYYLPPPNLATASLKNPVQNVENLIYEMIPLNTKSNPSLKLGQKKYNILQRNTILDSDDSSYKEIKEGLTILAHSITEVTHDASEENADIFTFKIFLVSSQNNILLLGFKVCLSSKAKPTSNASINSKSIDGFFRRRTPTLSRINVSDTLVQIKTWSLYDLSSPYNDRSNDFINQANCLSYIESGYFIATSSVSNSVIFHVDAIEPHIKPIQYLKEFNDGPILQLEYDENSEICAGGSNFQPLISRNLSNLYSVSGSLQSSEIKMFSRGLNAIEVTTRNEKPKIGPCFNLRDTLLQKKRSFETSYGGLHILYFEQIANESRITKPTSILDDNTGFLEFYLTRVTSENELSLEFIPCKFKEDTTSEENGLLRCGRIKELSFFEDRLVIIFEQELKVYNFADFGTHYYERLEYNAELSRSLERDPVSQIYLGSGNEIFLFCESEEKKYFRYLNLIENIDRELPVPTDVDISFGLNENTLVFDLEVDAVNEVFYLVICTFEGDNKVVKYKYSQIDPHLEFIKDFGFHKKSFFNSIAIDNIRDEVILLGTTSSRSLVIIKLHSIVSGFKNSKVINESDYLKYNLDDFSAEIIKSKSLRNTYYLKTPNANTVHLLNLHKQPSSPSISYELGILNFPFNHPNTTLYSEFEHQGKTYLMTDGFPNAQFFKVDAKMLMRKPCLEEGVRHRVAGDQQEGQEEEEDDDLIILTSNRKKNIIGDGIDKEISNQRNKCRKIVKQNTNMTASVDADGDTLLQILPDNTSFQEKSNFYTVIKSIELTDLIRKIIIMKQFNLMVVVTNKYPNSCEPKGNRLDKTVSTIKLLNLKSFELLSCNVLEGYEVVDLIDACYQKPKSTEIKGPAHVENILGFEDKTSVGLQKMLMNKFLVVSNCSGSTYREKNRDTGDLDDADVVNEFKLFSVITEEKTGIILESSYKNSSKSQFYSIHNFGYRLFLATGNKTGIFRINYRPSTRQFYIERTFEKRISRLFTDKITSINNMIMINDIYKGPMTFKLSSIKYTESKPAQSGPKDIYTVSDYAVANKYEDYEMSLRISIYELDQINEMASIDSCLTNSFLSQSVDLSNNLSVVFKKVGFKDKKLNIEKKTISKFNLGDNINVIEALPSYGCYPTMKFNGMITKQFIGEANGSDEFFSGNIASTIFPLSLVGSVIGGIYTLSLIDNKGAADLLKRLQDHLVGIFDASPKDDQSMAAFHKFRNPKVFGSVVEDEYTNFIDGTLFQKFLNLPMDQQKSHLANEDIEAMKRIISASTLGLGN
ncbi:hypothetical protein DASC09_049380 [Saccharomycopsis crataegensis]|uniref:Uncharacterized protein n=1 Tax=Saccharomycopsis crataegensis TaxID=43959 RepID=A0AAV5QS18_9ASCO|nr:hypothetical protein DASC09_049380 [Saccharomycopsis crataegensis]